MAPRNDHAVATLRVELAALRQRLAQAERERDDALARLTTTLVGCTHCGRGVRPRDAAAGLCPACAGDEIGRLTRERDALIGGYVIPSEYFAGCKYRGVLRGGVDRWFATRAAAVAAVRQAAGLDAPDSGPRAAQERSSGGVALSHAEAADATPGASQGPSVASGDEGGAP